jgi:riboflavin synthase
MFTGIIEELGTVSGLEPRGVGARLTIGCARVLEDTAPGSSIAVNGVCLTAAGVWPGAFCADVSPETLRRTNLGDLRPGARVNLERPLAAGGRLGGHIVQGHVDATGEFVSLEALGDANWWLTVRFPAELSPYIVEKGSIAVDGVSLTVAALDGDLLSAAIIPHTYENTALHTYRPGARLNLECDILAKYVARLLGLARPAPALTVERLRELGF